MQKLFQINTDIIKLIGNNWVKNFNWQLTQHWFDEELNWNVTDYIFYTRDISQLTERSRVFLWLFETGILYRFLYFTNHQDYFNTSNNSASRYSADAVWVWVCKCTNNDYQNKKRLIIVIFRRLMYKCSLFLYIFLDIIVIYIDFIFYFCVYLWVSLIIRNNWILPLKIITTTQK